MRWEPPSWESPSAEPDEGRSPRDDEAGESSTDEVSPAAESQSEHERRALDEPGEDGEAPASEAGIDETATPLPAAAGADESGQPSGGSLDEPDREAEHGDGTDATPGEQAAGLGTVPTGIDDRDVETLAAAVVSPVMSSNSRSQDLEVPAASLGPSERLADAGDGWFLDAAAEAAETPLAERDASSDASDATEAGTESSAADDAGDEPRSGSATTGEAEELELLPAELAESAEDWGGGGEAAVGPQSGYSERAVDSAARLVDSPGAPANGEGPSSVAALEELKKMEPWASPMAEERDVDPASTIAEALERLARRFRDGSIVLPPDSDVHSDEGALAIALAALLRQSGR
jgi:hypothetical protein